jgi:hypothetical protein
MYVLSELAAGAACHMAEALQAPLIRPCTGSTRQLMARRRRDPESSVSPSVHCAEVSWWAAAAADQIHCIVPAGRTCMVMLQTSPLLLVVLLRAAGRALTDRIDV